MKNKIKEVYNKIFAHDWDLSNAMKRGDADLYSFPKRRIIKKSDGRYYSISDNHKVSDNERLVSYKEFRKHLPERTILSGSPDETRMKTVKMIPGLTDSINSIAKRHQINPNLFYHRFSKEGFLDHAANAWNRLPTSKHNGEYFLDTIINRRILPKRGGFTLFGLDHTGERLRNGELILTKEVPYGIKEHVNEKGEQVNSVTTTSLWNYLELQAAELKRIQNIMRDRGVNDNDLDTWTNAGYNLGVNHKDLDNSNWIRRNYSIRDYGIFK